MSVRIAIVNRGEAAMRLIHAVRDLNAEFGGEGRRYETIALHTTGERRAMFAREADHAYDIGPASARPYLDLQVLEAALRATEADAVWVGWGFVAEDPAFAELCRQIGVTFIGPSPEAMRKLGDKIGSKLLAEEVGVPVSEWSRGGVDTLEAARAAAARIGYPLMLKATAGGGGRGIRKITNEAELDGAYVRTRDEAERAFGSGVVFLERLVAGARHVEVQIIADSHGNAWALGVRDCSVQRRNQKVIEESASPVLTAEQVAELKASAERLAVAVGYCGAGTVEFLYQPTERTFAFLEVNTRLQVEHSITELTTDTDLVKLQIHVAYGGRLEGQRPTERGHAVEARLNAEDPDRDFAPSPGRIARLELPTGAGVRVDTGVGEGDTIPADFDSMIAKIIAYGRDRDEALARLRRAIGETTVVIDGGSTNKSFVLDLLDAPEVLGASADTEWIDRVRQQGRLVSTRHSGIALVMAGINVYEADEAMARTHLFATAHGGRPHLQHEGGRPVEVRLRGTGYVLWVARMGPNRFRVVVRDAAGEHTVDAVLERLDKINARLLVSERVHRVITAVHGTVQLVEVDGVTHRISLGEGGVMRAPTPALVVATPCPAGTEVHAGEPVLVVESMKMETILPAPFAGRVKELLVSTGSQVETGAPLVRLEPLGDGETPIKAVKGVDLALPAPETASDPQSGVDQFRDDLLGHVLGFDLDPRNPDRSLTDYLAASAPFHDALVAAELGVVSAFADLAALSNNNSLCSSPTTQTYRRHLPTAAHSQVSRDFFYQYLRCLDVERASLPAEFQERLATVVRRYDVLGLDRSPELEEAVFRVFLAQQRSRPAAAVVTALLQRWLTTPLGEDHATRSRIYDTLEHLIRAAQLRFPNVSELARSVRYRWFDREGSDKARRLMLEAARTELDALASCDVETRRQAHLKTIVEIPEPVGRLFGARLTHPSGECPDPLLEVLVRRHYRDQQLGELRATAHDDRDVVTATTVVGGRPTHVVAATGSLDELVPGSELAAAVEAGLDVRPDLSAVVDLYLAEQAPLDHDALADRAQEVIHRLAALPFAARTRRVTVGLCAPDAGIPYVTARPRSEGGIVEDELTRGVHPMVARRLNLWRLQEFDITRIDVPEDVLLYRCVAPGNDTDVRLVAMAQVREFLMVRDDDGAIVSLPDVEQALAASLEAIRRARAAGGCGGARLDMNHVWLHIWPAVEGDLDDLAALREVLAPMTVGAALEEVVIDGTVMLDKDTAAPMAASFSYHPDTSVVTSFEEPPTEPLHPLDDYAAKVVRARRRGMVYPYELQALIAGPEGSVTELDLDDSGRLVPVDRVPGLNTAGMIVWLVSTPTRLHPEGVRRVVLCGDPLRSLGSLSEPECARVVAALDLAEEQGLPVEWFSVSAGARISMDSGTENLDSIARALKRIVEFTQAGGEINIVVAGINVGGQPYWNAEATMLMHTKGILVMTPDSAMVLTGKQSLDFSGGVSAEDNFGIGGYDRIMGPNGQAQYWAPDLAGAVRILMAHYEHSYVAPGEDRPRNAPTSDPVDRDITTFAHDPALSGFSTVGDIFSPVTNPERKKAFDIRSVMAAVSDQDHTTMERWAGMADAETAVVHDAHIGGVPVTLIGIESQTVARRGFPPADGPDTYTAGTLFPRSSKKVARAINASSGNRPVVVLANLSGFDGSPESLRNLQLEYGAEIGRAIVNFDGPIVFCVISRYHGGAFVVFSKALNPRMTVLAVEGAYASVIGGAPAAAVVFTRDVDARTAADPRVADLEHALAHARDEVERATLAGRLDETRREVRAEKLGEIAVEFDRVHDIHRAVRVGSVDEVVQAAELRPAIINTLRRTAQLPDARPDQDQTQNLLARSNI